MSSPVVTVGEHTPLLEIARLMVERRIGGVPVVRADGRLVGVVTESDFSAKERGVPFSLLRLPNVLGRWLTRDNLERAYVEARRITASEVMTRDVVTVTEDEPVEVAARRMCDEHVHRLPVVRNGVPVGIVARHDLLRVMIGAEPVPRHGASTPAVRDPVVATA